MLACTLRLPYHACVCCVSASLAPGRQVSTSLSQARPLAPRYTSSMKVIYVRLFHHEGKARSARLRIPHSFFPFPFPVLEGTRLRCWCCFRKFRGVYVFHYLFTCFLYSQLARYSSCGECVIFYSLVCVAFLLEGKKLIFLDVCCGLSDSVCHQIPSSIKGGKRSRQGEEV